MKIVQVTKDNNPIIYRAFELAFELEEYLQGVLHTDECICGETFEFWASDNTNESFIDRLYLYSSMLNFGEHVREKDHSNVILYIVENCNVEENYHGIYVSKNTTILETADKINLLSSKMVAGCFNDIIKKVNKNQQ